MNTSEHDPASTPDEPPRQGTHQTSGHDIYRELSQAEEFQTLRKKYRAFAIPWTIAFLALVPALRHHVELGGRLHGLPSSSATSTSPWSSGCCSSCPRSPSRSSTPGTPTASWTRSPADSRSATTRRWASELPDPDHDPVPGRRRPDGRHHLLGQPADVRHHRLLLRRPVVQRLPERHGDLRRLHVGGLVPRHLRRDRTVRLRRLPLLDRLPGGVAGRAAAGGRAAAQLGPLHAGRPAGLPDEAASGAYGGRDVHGRGVDLLPAGADGRRRLARRPAPRRREPVDSRTSPSSASAC